MDTGFRHGVTALQRNIMPTIERTFFFFFFEGLLQQIRYVRHRRSGWFAWAVDPAGAGLVIQGDQGLATTASIDEPTLVSLGLAWRGKTIWNKSRRAHEARRLFVFKSDEPFLSIDCDSRRVRAPRSRSADWATGRHYSGRPSRA